MSFGFGLAFPRAVPLVGGPTLNFQFAGSTTLDPQITFSRSSGGTWFNSAGVLQGVDFSTTSNTIGTGSKTFTLDATAGVNRYWTAGDTVLISDQANSANNMVGTVTSYVAATQVLVCNITSTGGSGTLTAWRVGSTMPRLDYNPSTLAAQGLLIEEARTNLVLQSETLQTTWSPAASSVSANVTVAPSGTTTADKLLEDETTATHVLQQFLAFANATAYTMTGYFKAAERSWCWMFLPASAFAALSGAYFNLGAGTVGSTISTGVTATIQPVGNGWYRCAITKTSTAAASGNAGLG